MVDLKCLREDCVFNKSCNCSADKISVSNQTECQSYKPSEQKKKHEIDKIPQTPIRHNTSVSCLAPCLFENCNDCIANGITVLSYPDNVKSPPIPPKDKPCCATFLRK